MWIYGTGVLKNTTVDLLLEVKGRHSINCLKRKDVFSHVNESVDTKKTQKTKQKKFACPKEFYNIAGFFYAVMKSTTTTKKKRTLAKMRTKGSTADSWSRYCNIQYCAKMLI